MFQSSSPPNSPPSTIHRSASLSARKTYSRRTSAHKEKRRAQALADSSEEDNVDGDNAQSLNIGAGTQIVGKNDGRNGRRDGSPVAKRTKTGISTPNDKGSSVSREAPLASRSSKGIQQDTRVSRSLPSSPPASRMPSPSPSPAKRPKPNQSKSANAAASSSHHPRPHKQSLIPPSVDIHPPSSSPPLPPDAPAPSTPPRKSKRLSRPTTPIASPSGYDELFEAVSPRKDYFGSPGSALSPGAGGVKPSLGRTGSGRPGGLRRMLTKTQSMGAVSMSPAKEEKTEPIATLPKEGPDSSYEAAMSPSHPLTPSRGLLRTQSMPESPSKSITKNAEIEAGTIVSQVQGQGSGGRANRTYGKTRTMLSEVSKVDLELSKLKSGEEVNETVAPEESYAELRDRFEIDNTTLERTGSGSGNLMSELLLAKAPQTVSDMRSKGENRRFMDELNYLIEGISDPTSGAAFKRTSAVDILKNMLDEAWLAKMMICGQVETVWESFYGARGEEGAESMDAICLLFLGVLLRRSKSGLEEIFASNPQQLAQILFQLLKVRDGPLDLVAKWKSNKPALKLRTIYNQLDLDWTSSESCTRRLASALLYSLCHDSTWPDFQAYLHGEAALTKLENALCSEVNLLAIRFDMYEKGLGMLPSDNYPDFDHLYLLIQILYQICERSPELNAHLVNDHTGLIEALLQATIGTSALVMNREDDVPLKTSRCTVRAVELLTSLVHESSKNAEKVISIQGGPLALLRLILHHKELLSPPIWKDEDDDMEESIQTEVGEEPTHRDEQAKDDAQNQTFFWALLALITYVVLSGPESVQAIVNTCIASDCLGRHNCLRKCHCSSAQPIIHHLSVLYAEHLEQATVANARVTSGHLALLISLLLPTAVQTASTMTIDALPGDTKRDRLNGLLVSLKGLKYEVRQDLSGRPAGNDKFKFNQDVDEEEEEEDGLDMSNVETAISGLEKLIRDEQR
ncbi:hypothetical protein IAT40_006095 [Kwoniella sp. CBS 6097]